MEKADLKVKYVNIVALITICAVSPTTYTQRLGCHGFACRLSALSSSYHGVYILCVN